LTERRLHTMSRKLLIVCVSLIVLLALPTIARADTYNGTLTITCTDAFDFGPGIVHLDRDNTGSGTDSFEIKAVDGNGTVLRDFFNELTLGDYVFGDLTFSVAPEKNPITVTFTSLAGNGLPAQQVFSIQGTCAALVQIPTLSHWGLALLAGLLAVAAVYTLFRRQG
jgi:hypothetical protein